MKSIDQFRRRLFHRLQLVADSATDIAFSRRGDLWQGFWVAVANGIDAIALLVAPAAMLNEKATAAE
jgi:hypothetical protein